MPMGMDGFPSRLFKTNAILGLLVIAEIGLSCILTIYQLRDKGTFSQAADLGNIWALKMHERGEGVLDNEPAGPSGPLEVTLICCIQDHREERYDPSSR